MNRDLISNIKTKNSNDCFQYHENDNQQIEMTQIIVDKEFDNKINRLQNELDIAKDDINKIKRLAMELKTNVNTSKIYDINTNMENLNLEVSNRLREVSTQLIALSTETKNKRQDKNTKLRISLQKKLANDLKSTLENFNKIREENQKEAYKMFKHQYIITHNNATEAEIRKTFEENNGLPVFIQELSSTKHSRMAYQESQDRNAEIKKIEKYIEELMNTFQEMQNMLVAHNEAIITIEEDVDQAEDALQHGNKEMTKAIAYRKSSRKKLWYITIIIAVILLILLLYILTQTGLLKIMLGN